MEKGVWEFEIRGCGCVRKGCADGVSVREGSLREGRVYGGNGVT